MSIAISYDQWGRMGNRMFQYAFGAILASIKNTELIHDGLPNFNVPPSTGSLAKDLLETKQYGNNYVNVQELIETKKDILINSYVQRVEYYIEHKNFLKQVFKIQEEPINQNKLVVHIRETDYTLINSFLGYDFYRQLIMSSGFSDVLIVTDNSTCDTVQKLISEGCKLNSEGNVNKFIHTSDERGMHDFNTLLCSENVAISQSSFSWWAAFLGNHKKIIFPFTKAKNMWPLLPEKDDINLFINSNNSEKFIF